MKIKVNDKLFEIHSIMNGCKGCGRCCQGFIPLSPKDIERIKKYTDIDFFHKWQDGKIYMNKRKKDEMCVFLSDDNLCKIYEYRPICCKTYPYTLSKTSYNFKSDIDHRVNIDQWSHITTCKIPYSKIVDEERGKEIITNLLENCSKFMK